MTSRNENIDPPRSDQKSADSTESLEDKARAAILHEVVTLLHNNRSELHTALASRITADGFLAAMTHTEVMEECRAMYDNYLRALDTGATESLEAYVRDLNERIISRGIEEHEVVGTLFLLRDVLSRSLYSAYRQDRERLTRVLGAYGPAANRIATAVTVGFVREHERIISRQQEAIDRLSTPVLPLHERLLILPIVGTLCPQRARQLGEQMLNSIREHRAKVVVMDLTGVPTMDEPVANTLVQAVDAARLVGAEVIVTGVAPELARTLVTIGVNLDRLVTIGDLQGGIEEAAKRLGYKVVPLDACTQ